MKKTKNNTTNGFDFFLSSFFSLCLLRAVQPCCVGDDVCNVPDCGGSDGFHL